ncbi:MAG: cupin domain-containing protein [Pseudomonadota bacterium]
MAEPLTDPSSLGDIIINTNTAPWHDLGEGTTFQLLRFSEVTGDWALYVRMAPGATFAPHKHLSDGEYFVTKGELVYDVGSAPAGTYGYEPIGSIHHEAHCTVETELLFLGHGPVAFTAEDGSIRFILDYEFLKGIADQKVDADISGEAY